MAIGPIQLIRQATPGQRRTLLAASMGWALDAFDAMLYSLVLALLMRDLGMSKTLAGSLGTLTLLASGIGGVLFGFLADRIGRKQALMASILTYSVCSFASGLATSIAMLAVARFVLGLGMGGEWNTGATSWRRVGRPRFAPRRFRSCRVRGRWALRGAALVAGPVARYYGWRAVFFVGILPALVTLWIQRRVPESEMWRKQSRWPEVPTSRKRREKWGTRCREFLSVIIIRAPYVRHTIALLLFNFFGMFAWWGLFTWLPPYLSLPVQQGGRGFGVMGMTTPMVVLDLCGLFPGYASLGWVADHLGRRKAFLIYTLLAALLIPLYAAARSQGVLLVLGTVVAFSGRECSPARGSWAARSFLLPFGRGRQLHLRRSAHAEFGRPLW